MWNILAVGAGGAIGAVCRYILSLVTLKPENGFPLATFLANIIGAFVIGAIVGISAKRISMDPRMILFLKVGICGGFTTFSSFSLDTLNLLQDGKLMLGGTYAIVSLVLGIIAVYAGQVIFG